MNNDKQMEINGCPDFPFFGATYPDATCVDGQLYDLDKCDQDHNLYEMGEYWPCPFCKTEAFIKTYAEYSGKKYMEVRQMVKSLKEKYKVKSSL
jgi:hypothetical protein